MQLVNQMNLVKCIQNNSVPNTSAMLVLRVSPYIRVLRGYPHGSERPRSVKTAGALLIPGNRTDVLTLTQVKAECEW